MEHPLVQGIRNATLEHRSSKRRFNKKIITLLVVLCIAIPSLTYGLGTLWNQSLSGKIKVTGSYGLALQDISGNPITSLPDITFDGRTPDTSGQLWLKIYMVISSGSPDDIIDKSFSVTATGLPSGVTIQWKDGVALYHTMGEQVTLSTIREASSGKYTCALYVFHSAGIAPNTYNILVALNLD